MGLVLRRVRLDDAQLLYQWRANDETQADWWKGKPVSWNEHRLWLADRLDSPSVKLWIAEVDGEPVGQARLDSNGELSVSVAKDKRGLGAELIRLASEEAPSLGHQRVKACIDETNFAARRAFEKSGFVHRPDVWFYLRRP